MKRSAAAQRITLFPFLAVLICTMGALLVLLVVISKRAQATAETAQKESTANAIAAVHAQQTALADDSKKLHALRSQITNHLAERRRSLGHIEDHMRRLGEQVRQLQAASEQTEGKSGDQSKSLQALKNELNALDETKSELQELIDELRASAPKTTSYRIVPYHGSNGTARRPIYLECTKEGVYFQPEGILITEKDFARPLGPENPLAAGIRAQSSFLREHRSTEENAIDPYPLLIVRPSGIPAYYAARIAIRSWESEFGYELVDEDLQLDFDLPDPTLARVTQEAINIARPRHQFMVARAQRMQMQSSYGRRDPGGTGRGRMVAPGHGDDGNGFGGGGGGNSFQHSEFASKQRHGTDSDRNRGALRRAEAAKRAAAEARIAESYDNQTTDRLAGSSSGSNGTSGTESTEGTPQYDHGTSLSNASTSQKTTDSNDSRLAGGSNSGESQEQANGLSFQFGSSKQQKQQLQQQADPPISDIRGENWALPGISSGSFPFARPIRVEINERDITLFPTDSRQQPIRVEFASNTRHTIEQFVAAIWKYMETWGTAGRGMYWKPVLNVYTSPGAGDRADDLEHLFKKSGIEIKRM